MSHQSGEEEEVDEVENDFPILSAVNWLYIKNKGKERNMVKLTYEAKAGFLVWLLSTADTIETVLGYL